MEKALAEWRGEPRRAHCCDPPLSPARGCPSGKGLEVREDGGEKKKSWDRNAITPGTPFMDLLASSLRYWVARKMNEDPGWANVSRSRALAARRRHVRGLTPYRLAAAGDHFRRQCAGRGRAQDHGPHPTAAREPGARPQHQARHLRTGESAAEKVHALPFTLRARRTPT